MRGAIVERLARSMIQALLDTSDFLPSEPSKGTTFGEILPHQAVRVLIEAPLPRAVRVREVELRPEPGCDPLVESEFSPVVTGDGLHFRQRPEHLDHLPGDDASLVLLNKA